MPKITRRRVNFRVAHPTIARWTEAARKELYWNVADWIVATCNARASATLAGKASPAKKGGKS